MMEAKLRVIAGPSPGRTFHVPAGKLLVGRAPDCDLRAKSEFVSGYHCLFLMDEHTLRLRDLGSKNGTLVNGCRIGATPVNLAQDDLVSIGDIYFLVDLKPATAATGSDSPALPSAVEGTELFDSDTVQAERPGQFERELEQTSPLPPLPALNDPNLLPPSSAPNP
jgi:pSer/pThr/pTyr-binding forkhead associated (FHA) protein